MDKIGIIKSQWNRHVDFKSVKFYLQGKECEAQVSDFAGGSISMVKDDKNCNYHIDIPCRFEQKMPDGFVSRNCSIVFDCMIKFKINDADDIDIESLKINDDRVDIMPM